MPSIESLVKKYQGKPFKVLMINVGESQQTVSNFMKENHYSFPVLLDSKNRVSQLYRVFSHPRKFLIDAEGNLVATGIGYQRWDTDTSHTIFDGLIKKIKKK